MKTAFAQIPGPATIHYREAGAGPPLVFLHSGWGYEVYPFDAQVAKLVNRFRIVAPDRPGYGRSSPITELPVDFHQRAAEQTLEFLTALGIGRAAMWGHSDGAVIAALAGLMRPDRVSGLILEAFHCTGAKVGSHEWMRSVFAGPDSVGERATAALLRDHGEGWRGVVKRNAKAWLDIGDLAPPDLYGGRLHELAVPALFIHGANDPRAEPGDLDAVRAALPSAEIRIMENAGHSPHSGRDSAENVPDRRRSF